MNPRLSIWYGVDPISNYNPLNSENYLDGEHNGGVFNLKNLNPYIYCYNNPLRFVDPNGKQVDITITNIIVGKGKVRLINYEDFEDAPAVVNTNLYLMTVTDRTTNTISRYKVTRDAWVAYETDNDWFSDNETYVKNYAFEPREKVGHYIGIPLAYPQNTNLEALSLRNSDYSSRLLADINRIAFNGEQGTASGVMIHVGGQFYTQSRELRVMGSLGCIGVYEGNQEIQRFMKDISDRRNKNSNKTINITIQKRPDVEWKIVVDSDGNKTWVGL
jgi:hypothetical protein